MKRLVLTLAMTAMASTAFAAADKASILHCGVEFGSESMTYVEISVSKKAKGHYNHVAGSIDSVDSGTVDENGDPIFVDYVRNGSDCVVGEEAWGDLEPCGELQTAGAVCGALSLD